jgi:hypothetical protein
MRKDDGCGDSSDRTSKVLFVRETRRGEKNLFSPHDSNSLTYKRVIFLFTQEYSDGGEVHRDRI